MVFPESETAPLGTLAGFLRDKDGSVMAFVVAEEFEGCSQRIGAGAGEADGYDF